MYPPDGLAVRVGADCRAHRAAARLASGDSLAPVHQCRGGQRALHELLPEEPAARLAAGGAWDGVPRDLQDQNPGAAALWVPVIRDSSCDLRPLMD
jgi:hypothetical protein